MTVSGPVGKPVLVVSNRRLKASLMAATLDEAGFDVSTAAGAPAAIELAERSSYEACLVDLGGLGATARFLVVELRGLNPQTQLIGFGAARFDVPTDMNLNEPFSPIELVELVQASLGLAHRPPSDQPHRAEPYLGFARAFQ